MANTKLSALTALASGIADTDEFYINDGGTSKKIAYSVVRDEIRKDIGAGDLLGLGNCRWNAFLVTVTNTSGTLQHKIESPFGTSAFRAPAINGASATLANTPNGTDASTAFTSGAKVSSAGAHVLYFDTADITGSLLTGIGAIASMNFDSGDATMTSIRMFLTSININGSTRTRLNVLHSRASDGVSLGWNTTDIASGASVKFYIAGFLPDYA